MAIVMEWSDVTAVAREIGARRNIDGITCRRDEDTVLNVLHMLNRLLNGVTIDSVPMRLVCERCGELHIDEGVFAKQPHHTHSCQKCGLTWRLAVVHTVGVRFLPGFKNS
jgi:predicted RNA-binding Zn-ribbon protein involved in translation (DUF1610 family)